MNEYLIGAGALLTAGPTASIAGATLHAQTDPGLADQIEAAVIDFEAGRCGELSKIVIVATGWSAERFESEVVRPLLDRRECTLADVIEQLEVATGAREVHLFARWLPDQTLAEALRARDLRLVAHPLEVINAAALVTGQRLSRWRSAFRAA
jgi:hypothetical protein